MPLQVSSTCAHHQDVKIWLITEMQGQQNVKKRETVLRENYNAAPVCTHNIIVSQK